MTPTSGKKYKITNGDNALFGVVRGFSGNKRRVDVDLEVVGNVTLEVSDWTWEEVKPPLPPEPDSAMIIDRHDTIWRKSHLMGGTWISVSTPATKSWSSLVQERGPLQSLKIGETIAYG